MRLCLLSKYGGVRFNSVTYFGGAGGALGGCGLFAGILATVCALADSRDWGACLGSLVACITIKFSGAFRINSRFPTG